MRASKIPFKDIHFATFRDPDPAGDWSESPVYESIWFQSKDKDAAMATIRETFGRLADNCEDWDNLTSLVEMTMKKTHLKWGWPCDFDLIDIPF